MITSLLISSPIFHSKGNAVPEIKSFRWLRRNDYYYNKNISHKIGRIVSGNCFINISVDSRIIFPPDNADSVNIFAFPPSWDLRLWWSKIQRPTQMRVDPFLCDAVYSKRLPIFNNSGCQLPHYMNPSSPRCQTTYLKWACFAASIEIYSNRPNYFILPEADHKLTTDIMPPIPFLITARNAIVSLCGQIVLNCGLIHTSANCMAPGYEGIAKRFQRKCRISPSSNITSSVHEEKFLCSPGAPFSDAVYLHDRIFVVAEVDDTYIYHIQLEIMPRIVYYLDFLKANPDIKILYGCDSKKTIGLTKAGLRQGLQALRPFMQLVGLSMSRVLVHRHVYAREVYMPMEGGCQDPVYNTWFVLRMRQVLLEKAGLDKAAVAATSSRRDRSKRPVMTLLRRSSRSKHTRNGGDSVRQWSGGFTNAVILALTRRFASYEVRLASDRNSSLMSSLPAQIRLFAETDVLIGVHGAGLGNQLYMRPNSAVFEIAPYGNDGRCLLGGGPFSRLAAVMAHNYAVHHPPYEEYKWIAADLSSEFNITRMVIHISSFLESIDMA